MDQHTSVFALADLADQTGRSGYFCCLTVLFSRKQIWVGMRWYDLSVHQNNIHFTTNGRHVIRVSEYLDFILESYGNAVNSYSMVRIALNQVYI